MVQPSISKLLQHIWPSLRDPRVSESSFFYSVGGPDYWRSPFQLVLRERAALLVAECFQALASGLSPTWQSKQRPEIYERMLAEAKTGFAPTSPSEAVHGSMLVCQALFDYGDMVSLRKL